MDHVAAGPPERVPRTEDAGRFTFDLEQHLPVDHVPESRSAGKPMWRVSGGAGWMVDEDGQHVGVGRNRWRPYFLQHGDR
ncbi:hypothetical protein AN480_29650 [Mycobacterium intracellulare subsp. chimaera]|nr:hypothetical protein AN480_29650 [Mycobacterium intracellulare subsp. chimaera]